MVSNKRVVVFHRVANQEVVECLDAQEGKTLWRFDYPTKYVDDFGFDEGPRATPTIDDKRVYTFGAEGVLSCLDLDSGRKLWTLNCLSEFSPSKGFFGMACSPLIEGDTLLLNIGGRDSAGIVAINKTTGKLVWKATDHEASYSSPVAATIQGKRLALVFTRDGLSALDPKDGNVRFEFPWRARMQASVNAATPLVVDDLIFLSASYQVGAVVLRVRGERAETVWSEDDVLSNHYATSVHKDGLLFGFDGRQEQSPALRCVDLRTGKIRWSEERFGAGTVTLAGSHLVVMRESGELLLAQAASTAFKAIARAQILPSGVRAFPALANGYLFARSKDKLVCVDLRAKQ